MTYTIHPQHRNAVFAHQKSQWTISDVDEVHTYELASVSGWGGELCLWGLYIVQETPHVLGTSPRPEAYEVKIAKFVGDEAGGWHGYPVAHWLSPWDKPGEVVLRAWQEAGFINRPTFSKIHRGKPCNL